MEKFKSGFITILGKPNVGKSTLMNYIVGEKISIMSNKPQTTRNKITSIYSTDKYQMVFIDTPGIHKPKNKLGDYMLKSITSTLNEIDVVFFLVDAMDYKCDINDYIIQQLKGVNSPVILIINKIDKVKKDDLITSIAKYKEKYSFKDIVPISAINGENIDTLLSVTEEYLEEGPRYFPNDMITDQPEKQIVSELIREKALRQLDKEIPHGIAVVIDSMKKRKNKSMSDGRPIIDISATIVCEKKSHKGIIIGKNGSKLKKIGSLARSDIEKLLGNKIYLELWVKVKDNWRESDFLIKNFGYDYNDM